MKVIDVKAWMKSQKITQEALAVRLGYAHRVTVAANLSKDREYVSPEFLGRLVSAFPETAEMLNGAASVPDQPESV